MLRLAGTKLLRCAAGQRAACVAAAGRQMAAAASSEAEAQERQVRRPTGRARSCSSWLQRPGAAHALVLHMLAASRCCCRHHCRAPLQRLVNKLLYRSKQRGFLELDLLVGLWAEQQVPRMDADMLRQFTAVLDQVRAACGNDSAWRAACARLHLAGRQLTARVRAARCIAGEP